MQIDRTNEPFVKYLKSQLRSCESVLDLGCGQSSILRYVTGIKFSMGVEIWEPYITESKFYCIHHEYRNEDITKFSTSDKSYDAVMCIDVMEHLTKEDALMLIDKMKRWSKKKIIIFIPNGFIPNEVSYGDGNKYQNHLSGWTPEDFYKLGFTVRGFGGYKKMRGEMGNIIVTEPGFKHTLYSVISKLSEPICWLFPNYAFHLCAVYDVGE